MRTNLGLLVVIGILVSEGWGLWRQNETRTQIGRQIDALQTQHRELARLRQENVRLAGTAPSPAELERLRADHAAIPRLRAEIDGLRERVRSAENAAAHASERFAVSRKVAAAEWSNAGTATPRATLETTLWAAAGGDIDAFASCLMFPDDRLRQKAAALLDNLPPALRERYGTPERFIAFLAINDVPIGAALVTEWDEVRTPASLVAAQLQLSGPDEKLTTVYLRFSRQGADWKLAVPLEAIAKYALLLKKPSVATGQRR